MANYRLDEEAIFHLARRIETPDLRADYLKQACGDNTALLARVEALLEAHERETNFLKSAHEEPSPTVDQAPLSERPGMVIGNYKLREEIGEGGMGVVFVASQVKPLKRKVALKVIKPGMDTKSALARFEAERQALALMDHPNIAKVFEAGATDSGRPYFVMELVRGMPITEYCDHNKLTIRDRLELFIQVCQAIQHAHQKGVIHRDIKPSNVLVTEKDGQAIPKVIDFGVAKALNQSLTERSIYTSHQQIIGTPLYMSPEQASLSAVDVDTRSDVYSLGVLLYELLTGATPLSHQELKQAGDMEALRIIRETEPPKPSTKISSLGKRITTVSQNRRIEPEKLGRMVRGDLDWIVMMALDKDRARRYDSASSFAADVQRYMNDEPIEARPPAASYRLTKFVRRNRPLVAATMLIAISLFGGIAIALAGWSQAVAARQVAQENAEQLEKTTQQLKRQNESLQTLIFRDALMAAMSGNDTRARDAIERAQRTNALRPAWIKILHGQRMLYSGETNSAYDHLQKANQLDEHLIMPRALLASAYALGGYTQKGEKELAKLENMVEQRLKDGKKLSNFDTLFLGHAQLYGDTDAGIETLRQLPKDDTFPLADAIFADALTHYASENGDAEAIWKAITRLERAKSYMPDNAYVLLVDLWSHLVAIRILDEAHEQLPILRERASKLASDLDRFSRFPVVAPVRVMYYAEVGELENAITVCKEELGKEHFDAIRHLLAAIHYRNGEYEEAKRNVEFKAQEKDDWGLFARAQVLAFTKNSDEEIKRIYTELQDAGKDFGKWCGVEILLLFQSDTGYRKEKAHERLRSAKSRSQWEESLLKYVADEDVSDGQLEATSLKEKGRLRSSRAYMAIAMKHLTRGDRETAKQYLKKCDEVARGIEVFWARAYLARLKKDDMWPEWSVSEE